MLFLNLKYVLEKYHNLGYEKKLNILFFLYFFLQTKYDQFILSTALPPESLYGNFLPNP